MSSFALHGRAMRMGCGGNEVVERLATVRVILLLVSYSSRGPLSSYKSAMATKSVVIEPKPDESQTRKGSSAQDLHARPRLSDRGL